MKHKDKEIDILIKQDLIALKAKNEMYNSTYPVGKMDIARKRGRTLQTVLNKEKELKIVKSM